MTDIKRYLLIRNTDYYPSAGTGDWIACFETHEEAEKHIEYCRFNSGDCHIVDLFGWMQIKDIQEYTPDEL